MTALERELIAAVMTEITVATERYGAMQSTHEGYGVLLEEVAELFDAIRANDLRTVHYEAIQVAAVALRIAQAITGEDFRRRSVK